MNPSGRPIINPVKCVTTVVFPQYNNQELITYGHPNAPIHPLTVNAITIINTYISSESDLSVIISPNVLLRCMYMIHFDLYQMTLPCVDGCLSFSSLVKLISILV